jgi:hypothetical protein
MLSAQNYITYIQNVVLTLAGQHSAIFQGIGRNLFLGLATIMFAWFGIKTALEAGDFLPGMHFSHFASLVMMIAFGFAMINYYAAPIPGIGIDFHHLITDQTLYLSRTIGNAQLDQIAQDVDYVRNNLVTPGITDILAIFFYGLTILLLAACEAVAIIVTAFGLVATAVCVLLGPIFIPFFIVPHLDWLFWGWLKCFIQYAFYQVVAAAVVFIIGNVLTAFMSLQNGRPIPVSEQGALVAPLFIVIVASVYALIKVPMLTSHIFSGSAGGSSAGIFGFANPLKS